MFNKLAYYLILAFGLTIKLSAQDASSELRVAFDDELKKIFGDKNYKADLSWVRAFIERGADPNTINEKTHQRHSLLHIAARIGDGDLISFLIENGAEVDLRIYPRSLTPLVEAVKARQMHALQTLIRHGADLNNADSGNGEPPLRHAVWTGDIDVIIMLLAHGANARAGGIGASDEIRRLLLTYIIDGDDVSKGNALHAALGSCNSDVFMGTVYYLHAKKSLASIINQPDHKGRTPFDMALIFRNKVAAAILLELGANPLRGKLNGWRYARQVPEWRRPMPDPLWHIKTLQENNATAARTSDGQSQASEVPQITLYQLIYDGTINHYLNIFLPIPGFSSLPTEVIRLIIGFWMLL